MTTIPFKAVAVDMDGTFLTENRLQIVTFTDRSWKKRKNENPVFAG